MHTPLGPIWDVPMREEEQGVEGELAELQAADTAEMEPLSSSPTPHNTLGVRKSSAMTTHPIIQDTTGGSSTRNGAGQEDVRLIPKEKEKDAAPKPLEQEDTIHTPLGPTWAGPMQREEQGVKGEHIVTLSATEMQPPPSSTTPHNTSGVRESPSMTTTHNLPIPLPLQHTMSGSSARNGSGQEDVRSIPDEQEKDAVQKPLEQEDTIHTPLGPTWAGPMQREEQGVKSERVEESLAPSATQMQPPPSPPTPHNTSGVRESLSMTMTHNLPIPLPLHHTMSGSSARNGSGQEDVRRIPDEQEKDAVQKPLEQEDTIHTPLGSTWVGSMQQEEQGVKSERVEESLALSATQMQPPPSPPTPHNTSGVRESPSMTTTHPLPITLPIQHIVAGSSARNGSGQEDVRRIPDEQEKDAVLKPLEREDTIHTPLGSTWARPVQREEQGVKGECVEKSLALSAMQTLPSTPPHVPSIPESPATTAVSPARNGRGQEDVPRIQEKQEKDTAFGSFQRIAESYETGQEVVPHSSPPALKETGTQRVAQMQPSSDTKQVGCLTMFLRLFCCTK
jgi:hypothetical protein